MSKELVCPYCGEDAGREFSHDGGLLRHCWVFCSSCGLEGPVKSSPEEAERVWSNLYYKEHNIEHMLHSLVMFKNDYIRRLEQELLGIKSMIARWADLHAECGDSEMGWDMVYLEDLLDQKDWQAVLKIIGEVEHENTSVNTITDDTSKR